MESVLDIMSWRTDTDADLNKMNDALTQQVGTSEVVIGDGRVCCQGRHSTDAPCVHVSFTGRGTTRGGTNVYSDRGEGFSINSC